MWYVWHVWDQWDWSAPAPAWKDVRVHPNFEFLCELPTGGHVEQDVDASRGGWVYVLDAQGRVWHKIDVESLPEHKEVE